MGSHQIQSPRASILVVDDTPSNLRLLTEILSEQGYKLRAARDGLFALSSAKSTPPDLILLDIMMPGMDGYQVCEQLKADKRTRDIPVIFVSASAEVLDKVKAFAAGGVDYITKPYWVEEVLARIEIHLALRNLQKELREKNIQLEEKNIQLEQEIIKRRQAEEQLRKLAITDSLTNIYNRRHFFEIAEKEFVRSSRYASPLSVILMDVDHFKRVNDTYGHLVGDRVLKTLTASCRENIRAVDILARYGGEEFVILLPGTNVTQAYQAAERLRKRVAAKPMSLGEINVSITISLGVSGLDDDKKGTTLDKLLDRADQALYRSKQAGRNRVTVWKNE